MVMIFENGVFILQLLIHHVSSEIYREIHLMADDISLRLTDSIKHISAFQMFPVRNV